MLAFGTDGFDAFDGGLGANGWGDAASGYAWWAAILLEIILTGTGSPIDGTTDVTRTVAIGEPTAEEIKAGRVPVHIVHSRFLAPFERLVRGYGVAGADFTRVLGVVLEILVLQASVLVAD